MPKERRVPQRTCVGCREVRGKKELIRVVRTPEGQVVLDLTGKASGRGAYLCNQLECLRQAIKAKRLEKALEMPIDDQVKAELEERIGGSQ